jgi:hypothetical protein
MKPTVTITIERDVLYQLIVSVRASMEAVEAIAHTIRTRGFTEPAQRPRRKRKARSSAAPRR